MHKKNTKLQSAKNNKNDEFYTQLADIEKELGYYKECFKNKVVYCNCDDPSISNFFKYFFCHFQELGLKKLIATGYKDIGCGVYVEYTGNKEIEKKYLQGNGSFDSDECLEFLKESDIVVTNPPFSLFRKYIACLIERDKQFLILGNHNAISCKEIFKLLKERKVWLGIYNNGTKWFEVSQNYYESTDALKRIENEKRFVSAGNINWFTNLDNGYKKKNLSLTTTYYGNEDEYPKYDNYDAINVNFLKSIPSDYFGNIGVPITFLDKHNPNQFEIVGIDRTVEKYGKNLKSSRFFLNKKEVYARIVIKRVV